MELSIQAKQIGIGLRSPHYRQVIEQRPDIDWLEIHSENFLDPNSFSRECLDEIAQYYPLSFHGVGLSLGSVDPINRHHLQRIKSLINHYQPSLVSEHLSWSSYNAQYFNDLLPIPYSKEMLDLFSAKVSQVQDTLQQPILIENPTTYLLAAEADYTEWAFLNTLQERTGCQLLLDLNNIYVNSVNLGYSAETYLQEINHRAVSEIHLAGFTRKPLENGEILIDTHGSRVCDPVWRLFEHFRQYSEAPALIEWDTDIPDLSVLMDEADKAKTRQSRSSDPLQVQA